MYRVLTLGLAALIFLPGVRGQDDKKGDGKFVLKTEGKLTDDDPKIKLNKPSPSKTHTVKLAPGHYIIDLMSDDFDAFVILMDPNGKKLADDDDSGGGPRNLNSRLGYKVEKEGDYKVVAASLDAKNGAYQLTVRKATQQEVEKIGPFSDVLGKAAPDIEGVFSMNGETKKLSDLKGKVVVVDFWAVWCGPCIQTFPHLIEMTNDHKKEGLEILGVTKYYKNLGFDKGKGQLTRLQNALSQEDENAMLKDFAAHHKLNYRLMAVTDDAWKKASDSYHVRGIPTVVVIDRKGVVRMVRVGSGQPNSDAIHGEVKKLLAEK